MRRYVASCIFCGRTDLSREHVWSVWTHGHIRKPTHPKSYVRRQFSTSSQTKIRKELFSKERPGDVTTIKLKVVCKDHCNSGWMSRLEERVQPILLPLLTGASVCLNKYDQEILATWIAMKLMICEFSVPDDIVTPSLERSLLMGRRIPPDIMSIWIGLYKGTGWSNVYLRNAATVGWAPAGTTPAVPPGTSFVKNVQAQSFFVGELFVHAVTTTVRNFVYRPPQAFAPCFAQIWPYQTDFTWPPSTPIYDFHAYFITNSFERFTGSLPVAPGAAPANGRQVDF